MTQKTDAPAPDAATFEAELAALEELVKTLEQGDVPLAEAMRAFEKGLTHAQTCENLLRDAQAKLDELSRSADPTADSPP